MGVDISQYAVIGIKRTYADLGVQWTYERVASCKHIDTKTKDKFCPVCGISVDFMKEVAPNPMVDRIDDILRGSDNAVVMIDPKTGIENGWLLGEVYSFDWLNDYSKYSMKVLSDEQRVKIAHMIQTLLDKIDPSLGNAVAFTDVNLHFYMDAR